VLLVSATLEGGGAERQLSEMANYWAATGVSVALVTWSGPELADFYVLDSRVHRLHLDMSSSKRGAVSRVLFNLRRTMGLRRVIAAQRPNAVLSFITENNVLTILASLGMGCRTVVSERCHPARDSTVPRVWAVLRKALYWSCDEVVAQTREAALWIERHYRARTRTIPNALRDLPAYEVEREPLIVGVGRLAHQKGFDLLLRAFARVADQFLEWTVAIVGEGAELDGLRQLSHELGVSDRVVFVGEVRDVERWMARAGLIVQPSRFEGFPNTVLEAMGMGAPVISSDCLSGPAELIDDRVNGRLVPVGDVDALAEALRELLAMPDFRTRLGREASKVRQRFRQNDVMAQWEACLLPELVRCAGTLDWKEAT